VNDTLERRGTGRRHCCPATTSARRHTQAHGGEYGGPRRRHCCPCSHQHHRHAQGHGAETLPPPLIGTHAEVLGSAGRRQCCPPATIIATTTQAEECGEGGRGLDRCPRHHHPEHIPCQLSATTRHRARGAEEAAARGGWSTLPYGQPSSPAIATITTAFALCHCHNSPTGLSSRRGRWVSLGFALAAGGA
jgi:hypothetical protein